MLSTLNQSVLGKRDCAGEPKIADSFDIRMQSALDTCLLCPCDEKGCHHGFNKCHRWAPVEEGNGAAWYSGGVNYFGQAERHRRLPKEQRCKCRCRQLGRAICALHKNSPWMRQMFAHNPPGEDWEFRWREELNRLAEEVDAEIKVGSSTAPVVEGDGDTIVTDTDDLSWLNPHGSNLPAEYETPGNDDYELTESEREWFDAEMVAATSLDIGCAQEFGMAGVWG